MSRMLMGAAAAALLLASAAQAADAPPAFNQCKACHRVEAGKNLVGPSLFGVYGRQSGTVEGFNYSPAMKNANLTWDEASLTKYLSNPKEAVPGNKMAFMGLKKPEDVKAVVDYLATLR
ncbi:cytochrome c family protein [Xanthobacter sp. V2C-8]|uniref:c-type cytochrome n=1 Tax=Xanthobacter albus TaxID=3119929 RepID=UPI003728533A